MNQQTETLTPSKFFDPLTYFSKMKLRVCFVILITLLNILYRLPLELFIGLLIVYIIIEGVFVTKQTAYQIIKSCIIAVAFIFILVTLWSFAGVYGLMGVIVMYLLLLTYILYFNRELYLNGMRSIETRIWKKPLDKKYWKKGELKNTKLKLVWRKTNGTNKT